MVNEKRGILASSYNSLIIIIIVLSIVITSFIVYLNTDLYKETKNQISIDEEKLQSEETHEQSHHQFIQQETEYIQALVKDCSEKPANHECLAFIRDDLSLCQYSRSSEETCRNTVLLSKAISTKDNTYCLDIKSTEEKESCLFISSNFSYDDCKESLNYYFDNYTLEEDFVREIMCLAITNKNPEECEILQNEDYDHCMFISSYYTILTTKTDTYIDKYIKSLSKIDQYRVSTPELVAFINDDESYCYPSWQLCIRKVFDVVSCEEIQDENFKKECLKPIY